ncbi:MAG TPA: leucyl/phenylalanyl-tRNA--protein transferase [Candidatus Hydrogenedentes bacterium]|nr:leucyl/phenylalanyl-tRNA--protein transferase [Candidatus Hydrogenedentota bacterium]
MPTVWLKPGDPFPPTELWEPGGLVAVGGGMSVERLLDAFSRGIFPWDFFEGDPLWYCPETRMVFDPATWRPRPRLARAIRKSAFRFTVDRAFPEVIRRCATVQRPGQLGTWIKPAYIRAMLQMHVLGFAHSVECWRHDTLVGGLYGVGLGTIFCGESMFHLERDASKEAFIALVAACRLLGITLIDGQIPNPHLVNLGGTEINRARFLALLDRCLPDPPYRGARWILPEARLASAVAEIIGKAGNMEDGYSR